MEYRKFSGLSAILGLAAAVLMAACSQDAPKETAFEETPVFLKAEGISPGTRSTVDGTWEGVTGVAVKIGGETKKYNASSAGDYLTADLTSDDPFLWHNDEDISVEAWCPFSETYAVEVKADQSSLEDYLASDILYASKDTVKYGETAALEFTHSTAKIEVTLRAGDGVESIDNSIVKLTNVRISEESGAADTVVTPYNNSAALLPPQTIAAGVQFMQVTLDGNDYYYVPMTETVLEANTRNSFVITVRDAGLSLTKSTIEPWSAVESEAEASLGKLVDLGKDTGQIIINEDAIIIGTASSAAKIIIRDGASEVILSDASFADNSQIVVNTSATIRLKGKNTMTSSNGSAPPILVSGGTEDNPVTLVIEGDGQLNLTANGDYSSGIELDSEYANLEIKGGTIEASAGPYAAGIGNTTDYTCGNITISGGTVTAYGRDGGAGIGSGGYYVSCGNIIITGGIVSATGGEYGAGIGSGEMGTSCGDISISGGTVTAIGGTGGAGIGSGYLYTSCGNISITGGTVTAYGKAFSNNGVLFSSAAIGTGTDGSCNDITISGTSGTQVKVYRAGTTADHIGLGDKMDSGVSCSTVTVSGTPRIVAIDADGKETEETVEIYGQ